MSGDLTIDALHQSLRGLAARQRALADNIANLETPNYLAERVDFEASLDRAIRGGSATTVTLDQTVTTDPTTLSGNNVNLDEETMLQTDTALRYQLSIEALNAKYRLLRTAIRGQG